MNFILPKLNFNVENIQDLMSPQTISYHYGKHHQGYINNLNKLIQGTPFAEMTIDEIIFKSSGNIFNNAAQTWNHTFYWLSLTDKITNKKDSPVLINEINSQFGNLNNFKEKFIESAKSLFGSGWTWLVRGPSNKLSFINSTNANKPVGENIVPLMVCDIWEHAYYIDFRNNRTDYLQAFWNHVDWSFVEKNFHEKSTCKLNTILTTSY
jgi:Fe-Mn family superoxide dismutase